MHAELEPAVTSSDVDLPAGRPRTTLDLAAAKLRTALQERSGYVVVTAESSAAAEALFAAVAPELRTFRTLRTSGRTLDPEAIVRALWRDGEPPFPARIAMRALIDEARAASQPIVVAITDADVADAGELERVRLTLEGAPDASEIVHIALLGGPALVELLRRPEMRSLALRIGASVQVPVVASALTTGTGARRARGRGRWIATAAAAALAAGVLWSVRQPRLPDPTVEPEPPTAAPPAVDPVAVVPTVVPEPTPAPTPSVDEAVPSPPPTASAEAEVGTIPPAPAPAPPPAAATRGIGVALQVGAFRRAEGAAAVRDKLAGEFPGVSVSPLTRGGSTLYRVRIGGFATEEELAATARALGAAGYPPIRVRD